MNKKVILVVDDDPDIQDLISHYLSVLDVEIHPALTGEEGVKEYKELMEKGKKPDIVVMDLNLIQLHKGKIDGIETTKRLLKIDPNADIYGFTAYFNTRWSRDLAKAGAKGVIARTVGFKDFRDIVKKILEGENLEGEKVEIPKY